MSDAASVIIEFPAAAVGNVESVGLFDNLVGRVIPLGDNRIETTGKSAAGAGAGPYIADSLANAGLSTAHPLFCKADAAGRYFRLMPVNGEITAEQCGVDPATETDAGNAITAGFDYLRAVNGGGAVTLQGGETYTLSPLANRNIGAGIVQSGALFILPGCRLKAQGATLKAHDGGATLIRATGLIHSLHVVTGAMTQGDNTFQLATAGEATQFAVGDRVLFRLGDISYDTPETFIHGFATVTAINTGTGVITVNKGIPRAWDGTGTNNKHLYRLEPISGEIADDVHFEPVDETTGVQFGLGINFGEGVKVGRVSGRGCLAGVFGTQYVHDFWAGQIIARDNPYSGANEGEGCRFAESTGRIEQLITDNCAVQGIALEDACRVTVGEHIDYNRVTGGAKSCTLANSNSRLHIERAIYTGAGGQIASNDLNGGVTTFGTLRFDVDADPFGGPMPGYGVERLEVCIAGVEELYIGSRARDFTQTIVSDTTGAEVVGSFPRGLIARIGVTPIGGLVRADLDHLYVGRLGGSVDDLVTSFPAAASTTEIDFAATPNDRRSIGSVQGGWFTDRAIHTPIVDADFANAVAATKGIKVRMLIVQDEYGTAPTFAHADLVRETANVP